MSQQDQPNLAHGPWHSAWEPNASKNHFDVVEVVPESHQLILRPQLHHENGGNKQQLSAIMIL